MLGSRYLQIFCLVLATSEFCNAAENSLTINPSTLDAASNTTLPFVGIRKVSPALIDASKLQHSGENSKSLFVPENSLIKAWLADKSFADAVRAQTDLNLTSLESLEQLKTAGIDYKKFDWDSGVSDLDTGVETTVLGKTVKYDATPFIAMTNANMLDFDQTISVKVGGQQERLIPIKSGASSELAGLFVKVGGTDGSEGEHQEGAAKILSAAASNRLYFGSEGYVDKRIGSASFGKILVQTAKEAGFDLKVVKTELQKQDVYLARFPFTIHGVSKEDLRSIEFNVVCSSECVGRRLEPRNIVESQKVEETLQTPSVSAKGVEVGNIWGRKVQYEVLSPSVVAHGEGQADFYWTVEGGAISHGSYEFVAGLVVPKGTRQIEFQRTVRARTADGLLLEGNWMTTEFVKEMFTLSK